MIAEAKGEEAFPVVCRGGVKGVNGDVPRVKGMGADAGEFTGLGLLNSSVGVARQQGIRGASGVCGPRAVWFGRFRRRLCLYAQRCQV